MLTEGAADDQDARSEAVIALIQTELFESIVQLQEAEEGEVDPKERVALLVDLPKDEDTLDDLRAVQVVNGVPRVPEQRSKAKSDSGKRHGDSAIALALAYFASREINKGPVKASSRRRRQAARMLEDY